ncbi:MAG: UDP-N-acetylmuramate--L-alanine ligase [Bacteroidales bacterium]|nr:UDP-N-acetylmuramate--L-alanine ligase [Bacteroidales bacterium]
MNIDRLQKIYFLGIGGIGMSALARYFLKNGVEIHGYDRTRTPLTDQLASAGIKIHFSEDVRQIPSGIDLAIYTPAIPSGHKEFQYLSAFGTPLKKRAEVLGMISRNYPTVAVAGTHGKTTTSTLIAHMLLSSDRYHLAFLGGISKNYDSNFLCRLPEPGTKQNDPCYCVVEADEYDRSFLHLEPKIAIITATDADHLDIYGGHEALKQSFSEFASRIKPGGSLISKTTTGITGKPEEGYRTYSYALDEAGTFHASNVRIEDHQYHFDFVHPDGTIRDLIAGLPGRFNLENAVAALAAGYLMGISADDLRKAVSTYQGVCRRFDIRINRPDLVYIDDYAHHPEELRACILAVKELYPGRKVTGIFQPHLYTRTRDFAPEFSKSLSLLDEVLLLDIYPAREEPIAGVSSEMLMDSITSGYKKLITKAEVPETLAQMRPELLLTLGAGDIDQLAVPIIEILGGPNET